MSEIKKFRCNNCGHRFEEEVLNSKERHEAILEDVVFTKIHCPKCNRLDIRSGWE